MKVYSLTELPAYEVSGDDLRIRWNSHQISKSDINGEQILQYEANEVLCSIFDNRNHLIEKIIGSIYSPSAEIATINNQTTKPDEYQEYQNFRILAKSLADGWINKDNISDAKIQKINELTTEKNNLINQLQNPADPAEIIYTEMLETYLENLITEINTFTTQDQLNSLSVQWPVFGA